MPYKQVHFVVTAFLYPLPRNSSHDIVSCTSISSSRPPAFLIAVFIFQQTHQCRLHIRQMEVKCFEGNRISCLQHLVCPASRRFVPFRSLLQRRRIQVTVRIASRRDIVTV